MSKAIHKLHKGRIVTLWKGNPQIGGKLVKPNVSAAMYSDALQAKLTSAGYEVPSPVDVYPFPGHYAQPRDCQREMLKFQLKHKRCYNTSEPRTGKSAPVAWEIDIDVKYNNKKRFLILAPLSTLLDTWRSEIFGICTSIPAFYSTQGGTGNLRRALENAQHRTGPQIFVVNFDKFWRLLPEWMAWAPDSIYIDEASDFNNPDARRSKSLIALAQKLPHCKIRALTGTPFPNRPTDAWSVARLINPNTPKHFGAFRRMTMTKDPFSQYKWHVKPEAKQILAELIQPSIRFRTDEVNDMPEHEWYSVRAEMTPAQAKMYKEMKTDMVTEDRGRVITANTAGTRIWKLLQIASGVCYDTEGVPLVIGAKNKVEELRRLAREAPGQMIVMSKFTAVQKYLIQELRKEFNVGHINGTVPSKERQRRIDDFQSGKLDLMVMHPGPTKYGLKLHAASHTTWFGPSYSALEFGQGSSRMRGPGTGKTSVIKLSCCPLEEEIFDMIEGRMIHEQETLRLAKDVDINMSDEEKAELWAKFERENSVGTKLKDIYRRLREEK